MVAYLEFEKPLAELEARIADLRAARDGGSDIEPEIAALEQKARAQLDEVYKRLTPWQKTQVARHPARPHFRDFVAGMTSDYMPLAGDRAFANDEAIMGGFARIGSHRVMLIGHEKGHDTPSRLRHNFGMGKPEGYRKAVRLMHLANRARLPVVTLVDTSGAFPGIEAEERGQAEAIARATQACLELDVPNIAVVVGEGGSGGAIALAAANRVLMLEHAVYSVISPEGCASILWRSGDRVADAAEAMKMTAADLKRLGVADLIVTEPLGGAHRDPAALIDELRATVVTELDRLSSFDPQKIKAERRAKFLAMGS